MADSGWIPPLSDYNISSERRLIFIILLFINIQISEGIRSGSHFLRHMFAPEHTEASLVRDYFLYYMVLDIYLGYNL